MWVDRNAAVVVAGAVAVEGDVVAVVGLALSSIVAEACTVGAEVAAIVAEALGSVQEWAGDIAVVVVGCNAAADGARLACTGEQREDDEAVAEDVEV